MTNNKECDKKVGKNVAIAIAYRLHCWKWSITIFVSQLLFWHADRLIFIENTTKDEMQLHCNTNRMSTWLRNKSWTIEFWSTQKRRYISSLYENYCLLKIFCGKPTKTKAYSRDQKKSLKSYLLRINRLLQCCKKWNECNQLHINIYEGNEMEWNGAHEWWMVSNVEWMRRKNWKRTEHMENFAKLSKNGIGCKKLTFNFKWNGTLGIFSRTL